MSNTIPSQRDQFQRYPIWTDRCQNPKCKHIASSHGPTETTNNVGKCRVEVCDCARFQSPQAVA